MEDRSGRYHSVLVLSKDEGFQVYSFKTHVNEVGERGILLPERQKLVLEGQPLINNIIIPYVENEIGITPVELKFYPENLNGFPSVGVYGEFTNFNFKGNSSTKIRPIIKFIFFDNEQNNYLIGEAYFEGHHEGARDYYGGNVEFEIIKDGAILLAKQEALKRKNPTFIILYKGGLSLNISPITQTKTALNLIEKVYSALKERDLKDLAIIKQELERKKRYLDIHNGWDTPIIEALELGYDRKLEKSLEGILEFFNFPI